VALIVSLTAWRVSRFAWGKSQHSEGYAILSIASGAICLIAAIFAAVGLLNPWTWTAIYHPELWIAKKVIGL
jgi:hypothetical protein